MPITRIEAQNILEDMIENPSLRRHCLSVALVMEAYAKFYDENIDQWYIAGLLHDADYEKHPSEHPNVIVEQLKAIGESQIAHAISAHHTRWGKSYDSLLDKVLLASDELTGFIVACSLIRPTKIVGLSVKSVKKRLKNPKFAAGVERSEVYKGVELLERSIEDHIQFIIDILNQHKEVLELT